MTGAYVAGIVMIVVVVVNPFGTAVPLWGQTEIKFRVVSPENGTAVLKRLRNPLRTSDGGFRTKSAITATAIA